MISWVYLFAAIFLEVIGTTCMKLSDGFTKLWPSIFVGVFYITSLTGLTLALKHIQVSVAYAIWSGLGTAIVTGIGIYYFKEPATMLKLISVSLIVLGVVGLHLSETQT